MLFVVATGGNLGVVLLSAGSTPVNVVGGGPNVFVRASCSDLNTEGTEFVAGVCEILAKFQEE